MICTIIGQTGSGKSTLLNPIIGENYFQVGSKRSTDKNIEFQILET